MQYMCLIYDDETAWETLPEDERKAVYTEYETFTESIRESGNLVSADQLQPISTATTVRIRDGETLVTDGPFAETKEQLGGYYLIFNAGYSDVRGGLSREAIRLGRTLAALMPDEPEVLGLVALMLLHDSRRDARLDDDGVIVLLEDQDRSRWDAGEFVEGRALVEAALRRRALSAAPPGKARRRATDFGPYQLQAAIAACHTGDESDWPQIVLLYDELLRLQPSPVIELNRAVALAMAEGPERGLAAISEIDGLDGYVPYHSARGGLLRRAGRNPEAREAYQRALDLDPGEAERRFLENQLR